MPLTIEGRGALCCPVVLCDYCGQKIERAAEGNYQWNMHRRDAPVFFTHKACCRAFEEQNESDGVFWGAMPLECLPVFLLTNLGVPYHKTRRTAKDMAFLE